MKISIIMPTLNAAASLVACLDSLVASPADASAPSADRREGDPSQIASLLRCGEMELLICDGGSRDETAEIARRCGAVVITSPPGRARQMIAGAQQAKGDWLLFLHADVVLEPNWLQVAREFTRHNGARGVGYFRFALDDDRFAARVLEFFVAMRCRWLRLPYGDQGLLIHRSLYFELGGFGDIPLMEDVDMVRRVARNYSKQPSLLPSRARSSAARYRRDGYLRRTMLNLGLISLYMLGVSPQRLAPLYSRGGGKHKQRRN